MNRRTFLSVLGLAWLAPRRSAPAPVAYKRVQAGRVTLVFGGQPTAMSSVCFDPPFAQAPVLIATASNEGDAGVKVAAQALSGEIGAISADVGYDRKQPLVVNWIAMEPTE